MNEIITNENILIENMIFEEDFAWIKLKLF